jgi:hypothetical protein
LLPPPPWQHTWVAWPQVAREAVQPVREAPAAPPCFPLFGINKLSVFRLVASPTLLSYTPLLIHSSHTLLSYTPLLHSSPTLLSYTPLLHSPPTLLSYTPLLHSSPTLLSHTPPLLHSSPALLSYTPLQRDDHHCSLQQQPSLTKPMPPRGAAPARRPPLQPAAATIDRSPSRCLREEQHQHDKHHCTVAAAPTANQEEEAHAKGAHLSRSTTHGTGGTPLVLNSEMALFWAIWVLYSVLGVVLGVVLGRPEARIL